MRSSRVLHPREHWETLDFVLAAIAAAFLGFALIGLSEVAGALNDMRLLQLDCPDSECDHKGTAAGTYTYSGPTYYSFSNSFCIVTMNLDVGSRQAGLAGRVCTRIPAGSPITATIWRGNVVLVKTVDGTFGTGQNPGTALGGGIFKMFALLPVGLLVAMIHVDIANHRVVRRFRGRLRAS